MTPEDLLFRYTKEVTRQVTWRISISSSKTLERTLHSKSQIPEFSAVMQEYYDMEHTELAMVPVADLKTCQYLPMHAYCSQRR